jgi:hypothetical protein
MTGLTGSLTALPMLALLLSFSGCKSGKLPLPDGEVEPPISVDRIRDDPDDFIGDRVRLSTEVAEVQGTRILTVKDDDPLLKEQMLVLTRRPIGALLGEEKTTLTPGDELLITGVVRPGDMADLEAELGLDLDTRLENRFRGTPVLVASELVRTDEKAAADAPDTSTPR